MAKIPIKFNRVAAAFDEAVRWQKPCDDSSSGSEYWPDSGGASLSSLVNSFIQKGHAFQNMDMDMDLNDDADDHHKAADDSESENDDDFDERKETLRGLLLEYTQDNNKGIKQNILHHIEDAFKLVQDHHGFDSSTLKRNVMSHLRNKGFDAGLCKSRWEKTGRFPAGTYEYIDVIVGKTRYMVEVNMGGELDIVRPTPRYKALLDMIPTIMIIDKTQPLKQIIRLMSGAMKESLKHAGMFVAPWRRNGYIQARYFSPYKRTINPESLSATFSRSRQGLNIDKKDNKLKGSMVGFEAMELKGVSYYCREHQNFDTNVAGGVRVSLLGAVLHGT